MEGMFRVLENEAVELTKWKIKPGWVERVDHHEKCDDIQKKNWDIQGSPVTSWCLSMQHKSKKERGLIGSPARVSWYRVSL